MADVSPDPLCLNDVVLHLPSGDPVATAAGYTALLGDPVDAGLWAAANASVHVDLAAGGAPWAAFAAADLPEATRLLARRGRPVEAATGRLAGTPALGLTGHSSTRAGAPVLDHVVFTAPSVEAAVALFGGCLDLDFRLVRQFGELTQLFFRSAGTVVEVLVGNDAASATAPGRAAGVTLWGVAWRSVDLDADHARLVAAGLYLSEIRPGRKPRTRVATVREAALGIPTILIEQPSA